MVTSGVVHPSLWSRVFAVDSSVLVATLMMLFAGFMASSTAAHFSVVSLLKQSMPDRCLSVFFGCYGCYWSGDALRVLLLLLLPLSPAVIFFNVTV